VIILLQANWYCSQNPGDECESDVIAVFNTEKEYEAYVAKYYSNPLWFNYNTYNDQKDSDLCGDKSWLYTRRI